MTKPTTTRDDDLIKRGVDVDAAVAATPDLIDRSVPFEYTPGYAERAKGAHVWDVDGRRYIDLVLHFGAISLGHADDVVDDAVIAQIRRGLSPTLRSSAHVDLGELLRETIPGTERVLLMRAGSDATTAAVRVARAYTGRDLVARWGYHGWHDWAAPRRQGIPERVGEMTKPFQYNDLASLEAIFDADPGEVACVIMMPTEVEPPQPGFLAAVRDLAHQHGAVMIFDEVRSGFRLGLGGAQKMFGVSADLCTFSKALGNGYPISAVTGSAEILRTAEKTSLNSSFFRSADGAVAALTTVTELERRDSFTHIWDVGERIQAGLRDAARAIGVPVRITGYAPMPFHEFDVPDDLVSDANRAFCRGAIDQDVIFHPTHHWFVCDALSDDDVRQIISAAEAGYRQVRELLDERGSRG